MKNIFDIYESILDDNFEDQVERNSLQNVIEEETGWTLSSDGKYILSGTKHFPGNIDTYFGGNKEWFEKLINCAKRHKLKIQPLGLLVLDSSSIHLLEDVDIEYICELKVYVSNPVDVNLSKIKSPIQRVTLVEKQNSYCSIDSITSQKTPAITAYVNLYTGWNKSLENIKNMNCNNLIVNDSRVFVSDIKQKSFNPTLLQQLVNNNPNVDNFYLYVKDLKRPGGSYVQVKLKSGVVAGIMSKSESALISKGVLEDFNQTHADFKQWYEKHI